MFGAAQLLESGLTRDCLAGNEDRVDDCASRAGKTARQKLRVAVESLALHLEVTRVTK